MQASEGQLTWRKNEITQNSTAGEILPKSALEATERERTKTTMF